MTNKYFSNKIVFFDYDAENKEEIFNTLTKELLKRNLVKENYYEKIVEREEKFPTGLQINKLGIAIPHSDSEFVNRSQIAFMRLKQPIEFYEMGSNKDIININMIFLLALKDGHEHPKMLQSLIEMFQKEEVMDELKRVSDANEFVEIMTLNNIY
ncbi:MULTISPECIES: PTS sugar transporter subunit IIA [unclassified Lactococcus]|uniref:PTS sugar transporter subunit IIA n=1 Tax=unclassified Lactococcus TaxID=2643510 RepID=UPI0011C91B0A|nr:MULTISPECIES: PTS sugar transporter subunit IIA [unclassified Lactococcus]MQW23468.1 PTS sugar transporter subunit IIA [Lactococcus sp. dk101]TXK36882.1 PTS sugar transporter subunit IIA [Lactococcus sp. dk310]TXK46822.1 PTS sugar transporter subunit IIA [Lactococcus sp. dk322]